jgi:hypothetical protein
MEIKMFNLPLKILLACTVLLTTAQISYADDEVSSSDVIQRCLDSWGTHPFGKNPDFRVMATSVKVFGIGKNPKDADVTSKPELVLVNPAVNVMGGTIYELLNPNGWYCFKAAVNVMGGLTIKAHCKAHIASSSGGATVLGNDNNTENKGVTVMGSTKVQLVGCDSSDKPKK